jgi:hypothetical protein
MSRLLKTLPLALAIAAIVALGVFAASCNSGGNALVRVVNAIPDNGNPSGPLDVDVNGTKYFSSVAFDSVYPTPNGQAAQYSSVPSGRVTINAYQAGQTTNPIFGTSGVTATLSGSAQYTMVLGGFYGTPNCGAYIVPDNNTRPNSGDLTIRAIDASANAGAAGGLDLYVYENLASPPATPTISALGLGQGQYVSNLDFDPTYNIDVYLHGNLNKLFTIFLNLPGSGGTNAGSITTVVIVDDPQGIGPNQGISAQPIILTDLS